MNMKQYLSLIDTDTSGNRNDVTPVFADAEAFRQMVSDLAEPFLNAGIATINIDRNERTSDLRSKFTIHSLQNRQG